MAVATKKTEPLLPEQLTDMLALAKQSNSVELKLTVPDTDQRSAISALRMDPLEAQVRQVFFFDTPDLSLNQQGVVVRARRVQGRAHDSVVKLRPVVPGDLPASLRKSKSLVVELDAMWRDVDLSGEQQTKTRTALEFFAKERHGISA